MKSRVYLLSVALVFLVSSCAKKKDTPYNPAGALAAVVKTITHGNNGTTDTYTYNADGKIQLIQNSAGSKTSYEYVDSAITQTVFDASGSVLTVTHVVLDTLGLISSSVVTDAGGSVLSYHSFAFDWEKHKTADNSFNAGYNVNGKTEWVWGSGCEVEYAIYDSAVTHKQYDAFYWYYDPAVTSIGNANTGQKFWGADSKFLVRKIVGNTWGAGQNVNTYEYTFDSQERITAAKTYDYVGALKNTDTYTYY